MHWNINTTDDVAYFIITIFGDFTPDRCCVIIDDFLSHKDWKQGMNILVKHGETLFHNVNLENLRKIGAFHASKNDEIGDGRVAFLTNEPVAFGIARQYEMIMEGKVSNPMHVFYEVTEAVDWLKCEVCFTKN